MSRKTFFPKLKRSVFVICWICLVGQTLGQPTTVRFSGISDPDGNITFAHAAAYVNEYKLIGGITLDYVFDVANLTGTFESIQYACRDGSKSIMAYIGPMTSTTTKGMHPVAHAHHIPHISPLATNPLLGNKDSFPYLARLSAPDTVQSQALVSVVEYYGWKKLAILTSNTDYGTYGMLEFQSRAGRKGIQVVSNQRFAVTKYATNVDARVQLKSIKQSGVRIIILNSESRYGYHVMQQANVLGMTDAGWAWIVTDGSTGSKTFTSTISGAPYLAGMIGTSPSFGNGALLRNYTDFIAAKFNYTTPLNAFTALIVDAVLHFAYGAQDFYANSTNSAKVAVPFSCRDRPAKPWAHGEEFLSYLKKVDNDGVAGRIKFNSDFAPDTPLFDIVNLKKTGWHVVGNWTQDGGLNMAAPKDVRFQGNKSVVADYVSDLVNRTLSVVTIIEAPFVMYTGTEKDVVNISDLQSHEIEGYCIDLLKRLSKEIGFKYKLYRVPDGSFGTKDTATRQWNGMVKELVDRRADVAGASFTINLVRETDIDFSHPYLDLGLRFLMKKDAIVTVPPFKFLDPFRWDVYVFILVTTVVVALFVSLLNKLSPYDYHGNFMQSDHDHTAEIIDNTDISKAMEIFLHGEPSDQAALQNRLSRSRADVSEKPNKVLQPTFTKLLLQMKRRTQKTTLIFKKEKKRALAKMNVANALWLSTASLLQQGGEVYPMSISARIPTISWWMGIMIVVATYTANLAAFLTAGRLTTNINSVEDLGAQSEVQYGTLPNSAMFSFFDTSALAFYQDMAKFMVNKKTLWKNTDKALEMVRQKGTRKFAYITDSAVIDYQVVTKPCNLKSVGRLFNKFGYGFGLQKNSKYNNEISNAILQLKESGYMEDLHEKWYKKRGECAVETEEEATADASTGTLGVENMRGVFYIVLGGLALSLLCLVIEWIVFCMSTIDANDPAKPKSFQQAFSIRMALLYADMREAWLPKVPHNWRRKPQENVTRSAETNDVSTENHKSPAINKLRKHLPLAKQNTTGTEQTMLSKAGSRDTLIPDPPNHSNYMSDVTSMTSIDPYSTKETVLPEDEVTDGVFVGDADIWNRSRFSPGFVKPLYPDHSTSHASLIEMTNPLGDSKVRHGSLAALVDHPEVGDKMMTGSLTSLSEKSDNNSTSPGLFARKLHGLTVDPKLSNIDI